MLRIEKFWTEYRTGKDPIDWVEYGVVGDDRTKAVHRVKKLDPEQFPENKRTGQSYAAAVDRWHIMGPAYEAWKRGEDLPDTGTPLAAWSGVTPEMARALKGIGIRTVEEVASMGDALAEKVRFPNARKLPTLAKEWLDGADSADKDAKIAEMQEQIAAMAELLESQKPKRRKEAA